jgi:hypothetical protein
VRRLIVLTVRRLIVLTVRRLIVLTVRRLIVLTVRRLIMTPTPTLMKPTWGPVRMTSPTRRMERTEHTNDFSWQAAATLSPRNGS